MALLVDVPPENPVWVHEIKFDGYRLQPHIKSKNVKIFTRGANDWSDKFPTLTKAFSDLKIDSAILDGEAVVMDEEGRSNFSRLQNSLSLRDYTNLRIYLFDLLYYNGEDLRDRPLKERKDILKRILPKSHPVIFYSEDVKESGARFFKMCCKYKLEGIISKDGQAPYTSGRSRFWCKSKCTQRQEFVIGGFTEGKGGRRGDFGALLLGVYEIINGENKFRYVGSVGTGFNGKTLEDMKKKISKLKTNKSPFNLKSPKGKNIHWIKPKLVAEINFSEWTSDKILRNPVFLGLRSDKSEKEIVEEKAVHMSQSNYKTIVQTMVELTHPEKVIFADEKITKQMIANYYDLVAKYMLPLISDRPLTLVRCPDGGGGKCFYQKRPAPGSGKTNFKSFKVREKSDTNLYMALDSPVGLRELVQMNAFEIHTWNVHYQRLMYPDQIILDFDPDPSIAFKTVVKACLLMKEILDKLKLKSFVKVTGGKGLHIHIPIEPLYTWDQTRAFSKALADEMVSRHPDQFISTMSKSARKGKIFIDYFRNTYGSTAVAPYSLRAKKVSAVALPVSWSEITRLKSSDQFTLKKALLKIKKRKSDPWKDFPKIRQKITILE